MVNQYINTWWHQLLINGTFSLASSNTCIQSAPHNLSSWKVTFWHSCVELSCFLKQWYYMTFWHSHTPVSNSMLILLNMCIKQHIRITFIQKYTTCFLSLSGGVYFDPLVSNTMFKCNVFETLESNNNIRNTKCIKWLFPYPSQACNTFYQSGFQLWTSRQSIFNEKKCMFCW